MYMLSPQISLLQLAIVQVLYAQGDPYARGTGLGCLDLESSLDVGPQC